MSQLSLRAGCVAGGLLAFALGYLSAAFSSLVIFMEVIAAAVLAFLVFGVQLAEALKVGEALDATVVDMRFVKPLDEALLRELAASHALLVTIEENAVMGGAGSAVSEFLAAENLVKPLLHLGLPDYYVEHAKPAQMLAECGLDQAGIEAAVRRRLQQLEQSSR